MTLLRSILVFAFAALAVSTSAARAETSVPISGSISVKVNMARILRISAPAATIIIGNPGVADVTIQDPQTLVLTGKSYGQTNLIVLDKQGNPIADTMLEVIQQQDDVLTVYQGAKRQTVACAPVCEPIIMLGDDADYATGNAAAAGGVANLVTGTSK